MNWKILYHKDKNYIEIKREGKYKVEENTGIIAELFSSEFWKPGLPLLFDNNELEFASFNYDTARQASCFYEEFNKSHGLGKVAWLANSPRKYGIGRQIQNLCETKEIMDMMVFTDKTEALTWLTTEKGH